MRSFGPVPHLETNQGQKLIEDEFLIKEKSHSSIGEMERIKIVQRNAIFAALLILLSL